MFEKGLEYFGLVLVIVAVVLIAMPRIEGQMIMIGAQVVWALFALKGRHWGLLAQSCVLFAVSIYAFVSWSADGVGV